MIKSKINKIKIKLQKRNKKLKANLKRFNKPLPMKLILDKRLKSKKFKHKTKNLKLRKKRHKRNNKSKKLIRNLTLITGLSLNFL